MSEFIVSARKYRPTRFDSVVGQEHVSETLKNALRQNRLAHAFLFCGPRGVGKTTNARILAKVLNCLNVSDDFEPCNTCQNCVAFNQNASFNIFELDGASNNKVDHMHQLMEQVRIPPQAGRKKVYIIDEVHMLTASAFNAFLKTLEEPPDYAVFILATTEKHKILPTILSRCQVYDFHRIKTVDMVSHLQKICLEEEITAEAEALHLIAEKADGALRDALSIFDRLVSSGSRSDADDTSTKTLTYTHATEQLNVLDHSTFFTITDALLHEDIAELYLQFDQVLANGFEAEPFLAGLARHLRQLFVSKNPRTLKLLEVSQSLRDRYAHQAALCSMSFLVNALNLAAECDFRLRLAAQKRLHVEMYLVKMAFAARTVQRSEVTVPGSQALPEFAGPPTMLREPAPTSPPAASSQTIVQPNVGSPASLSAKPSTTPTKASSGDSESLSAKPTLHEPDADDNLPSLVSDAPSRAAEPTTSHKTSTPPKDPEVVKQSPSRQRSNSGSQLPSIDFDDEDGPVALATVLASSLTTAQLLNEWTQLADTQQQRIKTVMRKAVLDYSSPILRIRVGSLLALNMLRSEATSIRDIKEKLQCDELEIIYEVDQSLAPKEEVKVKPNGPTEQYQILMDVNPLVDTLRERMDLELEG